MTTSAIRIATKEETDTAISALLTLAGDYPVGSPEQLILAKVIDQLREFNQLKYKVSVFSSQLLEMTDGVVFYTDDTKKE
jgi:hypothetical protein